MQSEHFKSADHVSQRSLYMGWSGKYLEQLASERQRISCLKSAYEAFEVASERASLLDRISGPTDLQASQLILNPSQSGAPELLAALAAKQDLIDGQRKRIDELTLSNKDLHMRLLIHEQKANNVVEEDQLRGKFVESLQEEVISLSLQLSLADEAKLKQLQSLHSRISSILEQNGSTELQSQIDGLFSNDTLKDIPSLTEDTQEIGRLQALLEEAQNLVNQQEVRIKNMLEEQALKSRLVQDLNDEILSLTMQLNLTNSV